MSSPLQTPSQLSVWLIGAKASRHSSSSLLLAKYRGDVCLSDRVQFFVRCAVSNGDKHSYIWVAALSWFMSHQCKVWFGNPCQVWASVTYPGYSFVAIEDIVSRVVYSKPAVNFGGLISTETVFVVVPYDV